MDHDTLVIISDAPSAGPLVDLLHLLHHQRLIRPFYVWLAGDEQCRSIADDPHDATAERYDLVDFVRGDCDDFGLAHLHLAAAGSVDASHAIAARVERTVRDSLSFSGDRFRQRLHLLNIVAPVAEPGHLPSGCALSGAAGVWTNLLVMPEVQEQSDLAVVPVRPDEEYVAHVAANLASIVGLWVGSTLDDSAALMPTAMKATSIDHWHLVRTRERLISAPELPDMVVGGVTTTILTAARRGELRLEMVADRDVDRLVRELVDLFVVEHRLVAVEPPPMVGPRQRIVGIRQFFQVLLLFIRKVPGRILAEIAARLRRLRRAFLRFLDRVVGTSDLEFRFAEEDPTLEPDAGRTRRERPIRSATIDSHPELWSGLRRLAFGLLDGSKPDAAFSALLEQGQQRLILPDPRWCVDVQPQQSTKSDGLGDPGVTGRADVEVDIRPDDVTPDTPGGETPVADGEVGADGDDTDEAANTADIEGERPPGSTTEEPPASGEAPPEPPTGLDVDKGGRGFVDRTLARMESEYLRSVSMTQSLRDRLATRRAELERRNSKATGWRARTARFLRGLWRLLKPLLWIAAIVALVVYLPPLLPVAGVLAVVILVVVYLSVVLLLFRKAIRYLTGWFREEHLREHGVPELVDLERRIEDAEDQEERLRQLLAVAPEWREVIRSLVYEPFGPPIPSTNNRIREVDLHLPDSHKVEEGVASTFRESGIVEVIREKIFSAGWLQTQYSGAIDYVTREQQIAQPGVPFEPDADRALPGSRQAGDRRRLLDALGSGRALRDSRLRLVHQVHQQLRTGESLPLANVALSDWLFTDTSSGSKPTDFLAEADLGEPSEWNRAQVRMKMGETLSFQKVTRVAHGVVQASPLPELPDAEAVLEGATVSYEPLLFRARCIEVSESVSRDLLTAFADDAVPATVDLSRTADLWVIPPPFDEGEVRVFTPEERDRWGIDETSLPPTSDLIVPSGPVVAPRGVGPYTFLEEAFGRPVPIRRRRIPYVVRTTAAPPNANEIIRRVLQHTADVTGLEFEFAGSRETVPLLGETYEYLYIGWMFDAEYQAYEVDCGHAPGSSIGLGGPIPRRAGDGRVEIIGGSAVLNAEMALPTEVGTFPSHSTVLLHEVGHALNLGHVASRSEIMYHVVGDLSAWGHGDRRGLQMVVAEAVAVGAYAA
ncbi:MAG: hypothetical protein ACO307_06965 [Ilumatobacteraceae bacterium]